MIEIPSLKKKFLSSENLFCQIIGAMIDTVCRCSSFVFLMFLFILSGIVSCLIYPCDFSKNISHLIHSCDSTWIASHMQHLCAFSSFVLFIGLNIFTWLTVRVCLKLLDIFSLRKKDAAITWCYIIILLALGIWIVCSLLIYHTDSKRFETTVAVVGVVVSLIFKERLQGVITYFHLRMHHFLTIGDWIQVPGKDVDGEVQKITLTSVYISNWDTTTSVIPIYMLHSEHFKNLQNMTEGRTYGRQMLKTFIFDVNWFCSFSKEQIERIEKKHNIKLYLTDDEIGTGILNAKVYRLYLYHWLMNNEHVSQQPRLIIRWMEQKESGMQLQIYAFITDSGLVSFEWQQSQIIEHIIESANWFNMQLFQSASAYDASNSNIFLTKEPAQYIKEDLL